LGAFGIERLDALHDLIELTTCPLALVVDAVSAVLAFSLLSLRLLDRRTGARDLGA